MSTSSQAIMAHLLCALSLSRDQIRVLDQLLDELSDYPAHVEPHLRLHQDCQRFCRITGLPVQELRQLVERLNDPNHQIRQENQSWWRALVAGWQTEVAHAKPGSDPTCVTHST